MRFMNFRVIFVLIAAAAWAGLLQAQAVTKAPAVTPAASPAPAATPAPSAPSGDIPADSPNRPFDPIAVLGAAKAATGGSGWNDLTTQHSQVTLSTGGLSGPVERWSELKTGRSLLTYTLGSLTGTIGFDGNNGWTQDANGEAHMETGKTQRELAINTAYRDQLAFWFPQRHAAKIVAKGRETSDGAHFYVVSITPEGGREFDLWINVDTNLIERLVEHEATETRTEQYMDFRDVDGMKIPFRVRATRGNPRFDEVVTVQSIEFDKPDTNVVFSMPKPPPPDFAFPAGKPSVELPVTIRNGHLYLPVRLNGKGPFLMLFDSSGANVLFPETVKTLGLKSQGGETTLGAADLSTVKVDSVDVGGVRLDNQVFANLALADQLQRVEGVDGVAGLIGYELLKRFPTRIDYAQSKVTFYDPAAFHYQGTGTKVPIEFRDDVPQVDGSVDGLDGVFDVDTGSRAALTLAAPFASKNKLAEKYSATSPVIVGAGVSGPARAQLARAGSLQFGGITVDKPVTLLSTATEGAFADPTLAGNIGYGILRQFNLVFDYPHQVIWFERSADAPSNSYDRSGAWVEWSREGYKVIDVMAGSPAADAGLQVGAVITAVDGVPVARVPLDQLRLRLAASAGSKVKLTEKGGKSVVITLRDLI